MDRQLSIFATIKGIGSASGLWLKQNLLYLIGDNSAYLYEYNTVNKSLTKIQILKDAKALVNIAKADKPDFEVLCHYQNTLYILGSGSTANRNLMIAYNLETKKITPHQLSSVYAAIKKTCAIDDDNLNIEGAVFDGNNWFLFNRGNGNATKNGVIKIYGDNLAAIEKIEFTSIVLLKTNQKLASFTDAVLHQNQLYFIAAAEDTTSTYHDGEILGSYIGSLNADTLSLNFTKQISTHQKFEGITFLKQNTNAIEFLLCEDRDTAILETVIYKLVLAQ
ncbi:hypothetical protein FA048_00505 [Pedobacter polaris]|uniref:Uncharacterized protein n=1 Tax=Pedobacter polaris TaxID=2571273 RepID=A0A4U1CTL4_9SPHI|nr:hypothetical protein [Pedobacter polaris]TKC12134.1 hypothetical protein FA048_00505 [Pedobacter polaris]